MHIIEPDPTELVRPTNRVPDGPVLKFRPAAETGDNLVRALKEAGMRATAFANRQAKAADTEAVKAGYSCAALVLDRFVAELQQEVDSR